MDKKWKKMTTTINTKIGENILKWEKNMYLSVNKLIVLLQKNRAFIRDLKLALESQHIL